jgi:hypothetical protein
MSTIIGPKGWRQDQVLHRLDAGSTLTPRSYDAKARSVDAILSVGSPVKRIYGTEVLRISPECVDVSRVRAGLVPLLDSHQNASITHVLGRVAETWFAGGALWGKLFFSDTEQGRVAEKMVARGEISSTSLGYRVDEWEITDADDNIIDLERDSVSWDDDLVYTATRFQILETSLVAIPADAEALIRKLGNVDQDEVANIIAGMTARDDMRERQSDLLGDSANDTLVRAGCRERMYIRQAMYDRQQEATELQ